METVLCKFAETAIACKGMLMLMLLRVHFSKLGLILYLKLLVQYCVFNHIVHSFSYLVCHCFFEMFLGGIWW